MSTSTAPRVYPVRVDAELDPELSRGLWLIKWGLAIPHYVVLAFLWLAFAVTSVIAFFSILFTARYPRSLFDFNVGVMRWSWRVAYYAYGALGTDRYPPFTLADVPDYPAHLEVDYPERLSRGLVLVKWWLLAIPHYLVVGLFVGGIAYGVRGADEEPLLSISLIGLLVLVAAVVLLVTGRYPRPVFDLVLGLNRWVLRVAGYVALMTDRYPPFSLDQGGHEPPVSGAATPTATPADAGPATGTTPITTAPRTSYVPPSDTSQTGWTTGRVVMLVLGSLLAVTGLGFAGGGATLVVADQLARDTDGFLTSPQQRLSTTGFAITSQTVHLDTDPSLDRVPDAIIGDVRLSLEGTGADLFVGIAPTADARDYLSGVQRDTLLEVRDSEPVYRSTTGTAPSTPPTEQTFWVAESTGAAPELTWGLEEGDWTVVVMNADGSAAVSTDVSAGAEVPVLSTIIAVLFVAAGILLLLGALLITIAITSITRRKS